MPGLDFVTGAPTTVAIQTTARTMLEGIAATGKPLMLHQIEIAFNGSAAAAGILCELCLITATGTGTAVTARALDNIRNATVGATWKYNDTIEPSVSFVWWSTYIPPSTKDRWVQPFGSEYIVPAASGFGIRLTGAASNVPFAAVTLLCEE
jgi:hypothetical protein